MKLAIFSFLATFLTAPFVWSHGEDAPGPHGGHIKMPANFHTEVVAKGDQTFHVYLIDMEFKNPVTKKSEIKVTHLSDGKKADLKCRTRKDHFICQGKEKMNSGSLAIQATRDGVVATSQAEYTLPLKPFKTEDHSAHQ